MSVGAVYFAWVDADEDTFEEEHLRWDENIFSFTLAQEEGDPASLTVVVRRPRNEAGDPIGLLGPGRKIWAWFALDCGPDLIRFRGRLVGVPTSIFEELVTLEFVARPFDVVAQKEDLAETLRVLPYYDEVVIDPSRRDDPEVVLEGYSKTWHYDRETLAVDISDEITGEDGIVEFDGASEDGKVLYDGLGLTLPSGPLSRVEVIAEYTWTQQARGDVDLTPALVSPSSGGTIQSLNEGSWPKSGAGIGEGWVVTESSAVDQRDFTIKTATTGGGSTHKAQGGGDRFVGGGGGTASGSWNETRGYIEGLSDPKGPFSLAGWMVTSENSTATGAVDPDGFIYTSSASYNLTAVRHMVLMQSIKVTLVAGYTAQRQCTERVTLALLADVQPILTDPEDGEALRIDDIKSVNLSEMIGEGTDAYMPIGDPRRRSYITTERGNQSLEHLIALARAHLLKRSRAVEISFAPKLSRMPEITLRKNAFLVEPRVGEALGKVIGYSLSLDGSDGRINCEVRIGCAIGRGGSAVATGGTPTYCSTDYAGFDYQQFVGRTVLFDTSVGYQPPDADPNDDGINFLSVLTASDVIESGLVVETGPDPSEPEEPWKAVPQIDPMNQDPNVELARLAEAHAEWMKNEWLPQYERRLRFKLKSMNREFLTDYELQVTELKIPSGIDLEATS